MADYITAANFKTRQNIQHTTEDTTIGIIVTSASRMVNGVTGRDFSVTSSADRYFHPLDSYCVRIDDAATITAVATDTSDDGSYAQAWTSDDYETEPANGVGEDGLTGWPATKIIAIESLTFPTGHRRRSVKVTGTWGWTAVPAAVVEATYLIANRLYEERNAPFGSVANADFGSLPLRDQRTVKTLLMPFMRRSPQVA